ncbi:MMPL family transporter [Rugosimonospora acidiphila]|uniref:MMPL family transporter n=1 Tax=Rugosimonospora acidiphila TaxID=556531 RepID=A0ABP9RRA0_9ACTN
MTRDSAAHHRRHPLRWLLPALAVIGWIVIAGALGPLFGKTMDVQKNDNSSFLPNNVESTKVQNLDKNFTSVQSTPAIVVYVRDSGLTAGDRAKIQSDLPQMASHFGGGQLTGPPIGPVFSPDGKAAQVVLEFATTDPKTLKPAIPWVRHLATDRPGLSAHVTGPAGILADLINAFGGISGVLLYVTGGIVLVILVLVYRSPILPVVVLGSAVFALTLANGLVYLLAKHDVITLNGQSNGILDVLVLGAATDYALLLVSRYREELRRYRDRFDAMRAALRAAAEPIAASGITVIIGLLCLLTSDLKSNRSLGPVGAIGIACSMLAMLTVLPSILALLGRAAFLPFRPHFESHPAEQHGVWSRVARWVGHRHRPIWIVTTLVLAGLAGGIVQLNANGIPEDQSFTKNVDSKVGMGVLSEHFPAGAGSPVEVIFQADHLQAVLAAVRGIPGVAQAAPFTGQQAGPGAQAGPPKVAGGLALVDATLNEAPDSPASYRTVRAMRAAVHAIPGARALVGGFTATNLDVQDTAKRDRDVIIPIVLVVVFVVLLVLLRSLVAPLVLVATVVLSFFATLGVSGYVFHNLFRFAGADSAFPLFAFVFLVALGVDYNIFLMSRVREEVSARGHRAGILAGLTVTGGVITSAGVVLAATFAALTVIPLVFLAEVAFAVAFGVLLDTLVVRSLLVPAVLIDIGRPAWWPGKNWRAAP